MSPCSSHLWTAKIDCWAQIKVTHLGARQRAFKVKGLTNEGPANLTFPMDNGSGETLTTSVAQYFQERYGRR